MTELARIRNFAIIAHIDHGKSTLADRIIERCGGLEAREMMAQVLDSMDIERERGITIKAQTVRLAYVAKDGATYQFNLVDTPGTWTLPMRSAAPCACEARSCLIDATQGVEAQTLANAYQAIEADHEIIPVLNKIDLPAAEPERVKEQIESIVGLDASDALLISAKTGAGVERGARGDRARLPPPRGDAAAPLKALLVDSWYDPYLGVVTLLRVKDGKIAKGQKIRMMGTGAAHQVERVGMFTRSRSWWTSWARRDRLRHREHQGRRRLPGGRHHHRRPAAGERAAAGFRPSQPVVFCGMFPTDAADFEDLRDALGKLRLNDASFEYEPETSSALGFGFRCGFLGLLHLEIVQERLTREFDLDLVITAPSVVYRVHKTDGSLLELHNPADMPDPTQIDHIEEPWIKAHPGARRASRQRAGAVHREARRAGRAHLRRLARHAGVPAAAERGGLRLLRPAQILFARLRQLRLPPRRLRALGPGQAVDPDQRRPGGFLSMVVHRTMAEARGRAMCARLKELIPRQLYQVAIQAAIGGRIIARETVKAFARTSPPNATVATSPASASSWRSRRKARSACARSARSRCRRRRSSPPSRWKVAPGAAAL